MDYQIIFTKRRSISLVINRQGELVVRAPKRVPQSYIEKLVFQKQNWITKNIAKRKKRQPVSKEFKYGELFLFLGKAYSLSRSKIKRKPYLTENHLVVFESAKIKPAISEWYKKQAKTILTERAGHLSMLMGLKFNRLTVRSSQTRWGSCSSLGNINFSYRLIMAPEEIVDYVVVHELAHLVHKNHSARFWQLVDAHYPKSKEARRWLRTEGHTLTI